MKRKGLLYELGDWNSETRSYDWNLLNDGKEITCEVYGEMADGAKCWYNIEEINKETDVPYSDAYWHTLHRSADGTWYFMVEGC